MTRNYMVQKDLKKQKAGRLGGIALINKYGNPGTEEGRKLGGKRSALVNKLLGTNFKQRKKFFKPQKSQKLAELTGILLGDGCIGKYQFTVTTNASTDIEHAKYVANLIESLFRINTKIRKKKTSNAVEVVVSSYDLCRYLEVIAFKAGNKIHNNVDIPEWIKSKQSFRTACLRGLLDTDGCVFSDSHIIKSVQYKSIGINFTNRNSNILHFFKSTLENDFGFHPTQKSNHAVFLRRKTEIKEYFLKIGTSNPKHLNRFNQFLKEFGRVA